jgi:solute carrier family 25 protein 38
MGKGKQKNADVKINPPMGTVGKSATSFIAGSTAGLVSSGALQPLEVVKTRMQAHRLKAGFSINKSAWATAGCVVRDEGIRGLWAGVSASCVRTACGAGLYFLLLERVTRELNAKFPVSKDSSQTVQGARTFAVGAASRALAAALLCPLTVVKTRMEYASISGTTYTGVANALYTIGAKEGMKGLFSGLGSTLLRDAPFSGLNLVMYTQMRTVMGEVAVAQGRETDAMDTFFAGAVAGGVATFLTHPPDVLRTRVQLGRPSTSFVKIVTEEGVRALWVGSFPRILRRTLQQAMTWSLYEHVAKLLGGTSLSPKAE